MTQKLNNDNGIQAWKTEHQAVTIGDENFEGGRMDVKY